MWPCIPLIAAKIPGSKGAFPSTPLMFEMRWTSFGTRLSKRFRANAEAEEECLIIFSKHSRSVLILYLGSPIITVKRKRAHIKQVKNFTCSFQSINIRFSCSMFLVIYPVPYPRKMTSRLPKQVKSKHNRIITWWCWFFIPWYSPKSLTSSSEDPLLIPSGRISAVCSAFGELLSITLTSSLSRLQLPVSTFEHELAGDSLVFEFAFGVEHKVGSRQLFFKRQGEPGLLFSLLSDLPRNTCTGREWSYVVEIQIDDYVRKCRKWK